MSVFLFDVGEGSDVGAGALGRVPCGIWFNGLSWKKHAEWLVRVTTW